MEGFELPKFVIPNFFLLLMLSYQVIGVNGAV
jgi:hypothetical protein